MTRRECGRRALAIVLFGCWWPAELAGAHAALVRSIPAPRSDLRRPPDRIQLWFNERLEPAYSSLSVTDDAGNRVDGQDTRVGPDDPKLLSVSVPVLGPGRYAVRFRVLSVDGHVVTSEFSFTIRGEVPRR
jgi:copper resistance protein C